MTSAAHDTARYAPPVRYTPDVERPQPDEGETIGKLEEQFQHILDTTSESYGHAVRAVHAKAHGIARGTFTVAPGLPAELAQGLFAKPGTFEAILRISTNAGDILDDSISLPRGLALKLLGVDGERLPGSEGETTQDFVLVNGPVFAAKDAKAFLGNLSLLSKTTDKVEGLKKALSGVLHATSAALGAVGIESATINQLGGAPQVHPMGATYYSQTPFRFGDYIVKWALKPVSAALTGLTDETIAIHGRPDAIREDVNRDMVEHGGTWEFQVQFNTDLDAMPVEDPTVVWDEEASPFRTVATLVVEPQAAWVRGVTDKTDDALAYNIWHGLAAHRPLGGINRARNETYRKSSAFRGNYNGCPMHEPATLAEVA
ncbi:catalase family protein [Sphingomonas bacterium]|uniref:catalase family protein n=1 Tax=Sphingomonas bacterium TaxID=1895847 RepID=UPI0015758674|nr:catalase family protein [Sphingomonas bacterium]